jgi:hypothetical protein
MACGGLSRPGDVDLKPVDPEIQPSLVLGGADFAAIVNAEIAAS